MNPSTTRRAIILLLLASFLTLAIFAAMLLKHSLFASSLGVLLSLTPYTTAGSIKDINHVVLFMQENRAFDHVCNIFPFPTRRLRTFSS